MNNSMQIKMVIITCVLPIGFSDQQKVQLYYCNNYLSLQWFFRVFILFNQSFLRYNLTMGWAAVCSISTFHSKFVMIERSSHFADTLILNFRIKYLQVSYYLCYFLAVWSWTSHSASLKLNSSFIKWKQENWER